MLPRRFVGSSTSIDFNEPAALPPPSKKQRTIPEATVSPSVSSQQDMDIDMADAQLLETFYQDSRHRAVVPGSESSTPPFITMGEHGTLGDTHDTERGVHIESVTVPTIVMVEEPSQASEGKSDSEPPLIESFSPLPEPTPLAPSRDSPLADLSRESGGQLNQSITETIQILLGMNVH